LVFQEKYLDFSEIFKSLKNDAELSQTAEKINALGYSILLITDNSFFTENRIRCDYRIHDERFKDSVLTLMFMSKATNEIIFITSIVFFTPDMTDKISFWSYDGNNNLLNEIFLKEIADVRNNPVMTLGYSENMNITDGKIIMTRFYMNFIKKIINLTGLILFAEIQGMCNLDEALMTERTINIKEAELSCPGIGSKIGVTRHESAPAEKFYGHFGLKHKEGIYHKATLGKVYFNMI
jgi:hypothetical protein